MSASKEYRKLNVEQEGVEQAQGTNAKELLGRMSKEERDAFSRDGSLPEWFSKEIGATAADGHEDEKPS